MVERLLSVVRPDRRNAVLVALFVVTWGTAVVGFAAGGPAAVSWLAGSLAVTLTLRHRWRAGAPGVPHSSTAGARTRPRGPQRAPEGPMAAGSIEERVLVRLQRIAERDRAQEPVTSSDP